MSKKTIVLNQFHKDFVELTKKEQKQVIKTIKLMEENLKHPSLNCHVVKGTPYYEVYSNMDIRVLFELNNDFNVLYRVGHHNVLDRL